MWTSSNAAGTRPETAIPAIPPPAKPAKHPRTPVKVACHCTRFAAPCDQRRIQPFPRGRSRSFRDRRQQRWQETSMKQGVELRWRFQFHPPPVFRPSRSASLALPPSGVLGKTEQAMTQQKPEAEHEPLNLLADWISREQLAQELGLTSDTLARWEARRLGPPCTRIGRKTLYRRASVQDWIRAQEQVHPVRKTRGRS